MDIEKFFTKALASQKDDEKDLAITLYKQILQEDGFHLPTLYNLATLYGEQHNYEEAIYYYERLLEQEPDFVRAYHNLAVCYLQTRQIDQAKHLLEQAVKLVPDYAAAQHLLGSILFKQRDLFEASKHLELAIQYDPELSEAFCHLGMLRLQQEDLGSAYVYLSRAIELQPAHAEAHYHLGLIYLKKGDEEKAEIYFTGAIDRDENHFSALYNMGLIKKKEHFNKLADEYFLRAQRLQPDNAHVQFMRDSLGSSNHPDHAPQTFVTELFDRYANYYDAQMKEGLHYQAPNHLFNLFRDCVKPQENSLTIVDLGCGTGFVGEKFKLFSNTLIGIDLSEPMLSKAREKNTYDELIHQDIVTAMDDISNQSVDCFVAADVFGYIGKLDEVFDTVAKKITSQGYFLFSIETHVGSEDYRLTEHTRFSHQPSYIHRLIDVFNFSIVAEQPGILREQDQQPVQGCYYLLRKID